MGKIKRESFYDKDYFETTKKRCAPRYSEEVIYPLMLGVASYFYRKYKPKRVLDLGCAKGFLVKAFLDLGVKEVYGVDISKYAVEQALPEVKERLKIADVEESLPFSDNFFNLVTALDIMEHLTSPEESLQEIHRVLKWGGVLFIRTPSPLSPNAAKDPTHISVHGVDYWRKIFKRMGFKHRWVYQDQLEERKLKGKSLRSKIKIILSKIKWRLHSLRTWKRGNYHFLLTKVG